TTPRMSTSVSACRRPARSSGTTSVPPWIGVPPSSSRSDARRSSNLPLFARLGLTKRAQHLFTRDRQPPHIRAGRVADRIRDRRRDRDDRRLAEPLRAEVRQVLV